MVKDTIHTQILKEYSVLEKEYCAVTSTFVSTLNLHLQLVLSFKHLYWQVARKIITFVSAKSYLALLCL